MRFFRWFQSRASKFVVKMSFELELKSSLARRSTKTRTNIQFFDNVFVVKVKCSYVDKRASKKHLMETESGLLLHRQYVNERFKSKIMVKVSMKFYFKISKNQEKIC